MLGPIEQGAAMRLEAKVKGAAQVDMGVGDRSDVRKMLLRELIGAFRDNRVDPPRIPVDHQIGDEGQRSRDRSQFFVGAAMGDADRAGMDRSLQAMDRFALARSAWTVRRNSTLAR